MIVTYKKLMHGPRPETFSWTELIMEGDGENAAIDETNPRVRAIRARIQEKSEKKKAINFLIKLDRRFTSLLDELVNELAKG